MEQVIFYISLIGCILGGFILMMGIWTGLKVLFFEKREISKGIEVLCYIIFVVAYYLVCINLTMMIFDIDSIMTLTAGMYGASIGSKLKELKKKKRYSY